MDWRSKSGSTKVVRKHQCVSELAVFIKINGKMLLIVEIKINI